MTQFLFNIFNHNELGQRSLEDVIGIFGHQLRALGHTAIWQPDNTQFLGKGNGINIVIEGFVRGSIDAMAVAKSQGARFIILATEEPTPKGFNWGTQPEMIMRQKTFPEAAKHCEGVLHLVPGKHVTDWYGQFAPTAQVELGFAPTLVRPQMVQPEFDFGFYGSITPRRFKILKKLARRTNGTIKIMGDFRSQTDRDKAMQKAKVVIQLRKFEQMGLVSSSRCNTALCLGRPVIAEPHDLSKPWDEIVRFSSSLDGFYNLALLAKTVWREIHRDQMDKFKKMLSPEICVGKPLYDIGIVGNPEGRAAA